MAVKQHDSKVDRIGSWLHPSHPRSSGHAMSFSRFQPRFPRGSRRISKVQDLGSQKTEVEQNEMT